MGLFELFKKQNNNQKSEIGFIEDDDSSSANDNKSYFEENEDGFVENGVNEPRILTAKLFFNELPIIDKNIIFDELKVKYPNINVLEGANLFTYSFTGNQSGNNDVLFQCCLMTTTDMYIQPLPQEAFRQNWHWKEAGNIVQNCKYELLLTEKTLIPHNYKLRTEIFIDFVSACIKGTRPAVVYSKNSEKLLDPKEVLACHTTLDPDILHPLTNIRMFKVADSATGEIIMDTIGLNSLGLPDFEILFSNQNPAKVAELLLRYCYFIYDIGDNILHGEYLEGLYPEEKWRCEKRISVLPPQRVVLHVLVS